MNYTIYCDGGVLNNQTPHLRRAYFSCHMKDDEKTIKTIEKRQFKRQYTNNECEYLGVILSLVSAKKTIKELTDHIELNTDSMLVVKQISGEYKVKADNLKVYYRKLKTILKNYPCKVNLNWMSRNIISKELGH